MAGRSRSHGARRFVALAALTTALAACSLLTGLDADYKLKGAGSESEGGPPDGPAPDVDLPDAKQDGPATIDGGDAGPPVAYCASLDAGSVATDFFCDDFENSEIDSDGGLAGEWTGVVNLVGAGTGTVKTMADAGRGGSRGLDVVSNTTVGRSSRVYKSMTHPKESDQFLEYDLQFDVRVESSTLSYVAFGLVVFEPFMKVKEHGIAGYGPAAGYKLARQAIVGDPAPTLTYPNEAKWVHVHVRLNHAAAGTPFTRSITIADVPVDDAPNGGHTPTAGLAPELWIGIFNSNNAGLAHAQFDNVVFRRR
jgi:hypothetical protein